MRLEYRIGLTQLRRLDQVDTPWVMIIVMLARTLGRADRVSGFLAAPVRAGGQDG
jgi:hypothetical protein